MNKSHINLLEMSLFISSLLLLGFIFTISFIQITIFGVLSGIHQLEYFLKTLASLDHMILFSLIEIV